MVEVAVGLSQFKGAAARTVAVLVASLTMSGCASLGESSLSNPFAGNKPAPTEPDVAKLPQNELQKATEYWGKQYSEKPTDLDAALNFAKNLKALGQKQQALGVLQQAAMFHATDRKLNSEYGRLALELDQISAADQLLTAADDPANPDWRVISARGTVLSKKGKYAEAIPLYERALQLSADQPSVMNNLALAYAMNGEAERAEGVLKRISSSGGANAKVRQNLALVLGLQGKYDEATQVGSEVAPSSTATSNTDVIKQIVRLEAKPFAPIPVNAATWEPVVAAAPRAPSAAWQTKVASAKPAAASLKPATTEMMGPPAPASHVADAGSPDLRPTTP